jgi:predicted PurR-regulated permease PerM
LGFPNRRTANVLLTILLFAGVLAVVFIARRVFVIFAFAILFAYLIDPIVRFLQRHSLFFKTLRGPHILEAYVALLILIFLALHMVAPQLPHEARKLLTETPQLSEDLSTGDIAIRLGGKYGWTGDQQSRAKSFLIQHRETIQEMAGSIKRAAPAAIGSLFLIPILALFFLSDGPLLADSFLRLVSTKDNFESLRSFADDLHVMFRHYIKAKVILAGLSLLYCSATMLALRFPHALALGLLAGILEFIPVAGWMISATTILTFGALTHSHWIWMAALLGLWRLLMDYFISPRVVGHELEFHPLLAIFAVMVGGAVGGIVGIYLSVPLFAMLRLAWQRFSLLGHNDAGTHERPPASESRPLPGNAEESAS